MSLLAPSSGDFPVLPHTGVAYLDSAATSQTPLPVIEAMDAYYREYRASIHRGIYPLAAAATEAYEGARDKVAAFTGSTPGETVFTRNATEAINLVAYAWGGANVAAESRYATPVCGRTGKSPEEGASRLMPPPPPRRGSSRSRAARAARRAPGRPP